MNQLLVANYDSDVGYAWKLIEKFWARIATAGDARGIATHLVFPTITKVSDTLRGAPISISAVGTTDFSRAGRAALLERARSLRPVAIYFTDRPYFHWFYAELRRASGARVVLHDHTPGDQSSSGRAKALLKYLLARSPAAADLYIGVARHVGRRLCDTVMIPSSRVSVVENGVDPLRPKRGRVAVRRELGIPEDEIVVSLCGRASMYKGLDFALLVAERCLETASSLRFLHIGGGPDLVEMQRAARERGLGEHFRFLGPREDVADILSASDVGFHPSRGEGLSLAMLEMMGSGLPVVAPDRPSVCEPIEHMRTGAVFARENVAAAAELLLTFARSAPLRIGTGHRAREEVERRYQLAHTLDRLERVFDAAVWQT